MGGGFDVKTTRGGVGDLEDELITKKGWSCLGKAGNSQPLVL